MDQNKKQTIGILFENYKELSDLISIIEGLKEKIDFKLKIISPSILYHDKMSVDFLEKIDEKTEIYYINPRENQKFQSLSQLEKLKHIFKEKKGMIDFFDDVDFVLSGVQIIIERILYKELRKKNVKFFVYHRHLLFKNKINKINKLYKIPFFKTITSLLNLDFIIPEVFNVGFADKYLVLGKVNKDYLESFGVDSNKIDIVGSLEYDNVTLPENIEKIDKKRICYITSAFESINHSVGEENEKKKIADLIKFVEKRSDEYQLTIRVHPRANFEKYETLKRENPSIILEYPTGNSIIYDLYKYDISIGGFSTAMFEIAIFNKPVLFYCYEDEREEYVEILKYTPKENIIDSIDKGLNFDPIDISDVILYDPKETSKSKILKVLLKELNA